MTLITNHLPLIGSIAGLVVAIDSWVMPFLPVKYNGVAAAINKAAGNVQDIVAQAEKSKVTP